ncbi:hypothetical protein FGIG_01746 [Fasciola gigantica]|uniref:CCR4-NOT transcription complex subunit 10 n=1 Tax=Fasciola gigantica TaxID=46835 RepID=A0A504Z6C2_FASGI|nr:hypothetical protein FGIG_01746 [Fasciola gigantica]
MDQFKTDSSRSCSEETTLSTEAAFYFSSKQYEKCDVATKQLLDLKNNDPKVIMNKALLDFVHKHGYTHIDEYMAELKRIASVEKITLSFSHPTSGDEAEPSGNLTDLSDPPLTESTQVSTPGLYKSTLPQSVLGIGLQYNYALVLFYQRKYTQSEHLLTNCLGFSRKTGILCPETPCLQTISGIELTPSTDVTLSRRVVLLWLEVLLRLQHPEEVYNLCGTWLTYLSSLVIANTLNASGPTASITIGSRHLNTQTAHMLSGIRLPLQLFYIRACLLTGRITEASDELQIVHSERTQSSTCAKASFALPDEILSANSKEMSVSQLPEEGTEPMNGSTIFGSDTIDKSQSLNPEMVLDGTGHVNWDVERCLGFVEAQLAYLKDKSSDALRLLTNIAPCSRAPLDTGQCECAMIWNNMALVHHRAGQYNLSGLQLRRALRETDRMIREAIPQSRTSGKTVHKSFGYLTANDPCLLDQIPLHAFSLSAHHTLLHNFGLQLLFVRKPSVAFATLLQLVHTYPRNPRLWFRLAECCIKLHRPNNLQPWQLETRKRLVVESVGVGPCRHLMVGVKQSESTKPRIEAPFMSAPTLEFASRCLRNALILLPRPPSNLTSAEHSSTERRDALLRWSESQRVPALPAPSVIRGVGLLHLLSAVYVATAYVALCLNNPVDTLASAGRLLAASHMRTLSDGVHLSGDLQSSDEIRTAASSHGSAGPGQPDVSTGNSLPAATSSGSFASKLPTGCGSDPLCLISPSAYRYLARLYYAEALIMMDRCQHFTLFYPLLVHLLRLPESLSVLSYGSTRPLSDGDCVNELSSALRSVSLAPQYLIPNLSVEQNASMDVAQKNSKNEIVPQSEICHRNEHGPIYPTDFPASPTQATSLHLFNLACALAISREWTVAQYYLLPSLSGLALSAAELDGRKWLLTSSTGAYPPPGITLTSTPLVLPFPAIVLQLYLFLVLGKRQEALALLRDLFGNECLIGRVNGTNQSITLVPSPTETSMGNPVFTKEPSWVSNDLRHLLKSNVTARPGVNPMMSNLTNGTVVNTSTSGQSSSTGQPQRPTSLWLPPSISSSSGSRPIQSAVGSMYSGSSLSAPPQSQFSNVSAMNMNGRWDNRIPPTQPHTTGLITSANESDWPPL